MNIEKYLLLNKYLLSLFGVSDFRGRHTIMSSCGKFSQCFGIKGFVFTIDDEKTITTSLIGSSPSSIILLRKLNSLNIVPKITLPFARSSRRWKVIFGS